MEITYRIPLQNFSILQLLYPKLEVIESSYTAQMMGEPYCTFKSYTQISFKHMYDLQIELIRNSYPPVEELPYEILRVLSREFEWFDNSDKSHKTVIDALRYLRDTKWQSHQ